MNQACNRKQKRDDGEEFDDCIPSAKRAKLKNFRDNPNVDVNFSHSFFHVPVTASQSIVPHKDEIAGGEFNVANACYHRNVDQNNGVHIEVSRIPEHNNLKYLPDLNASENPFYYENNRLLFELHVERIQRSSFHPPSTSHT